MKLSKLKTSVTLVAAILAMWASMASRVLAQNQPGVVISIASVDETMADINWVAQAAGQQQQVGMLALIAGMYTQLLDTSKPGGVVINFDAAGKPSPVGFVPVKNMQGFLALLSQQGVQPKDVGNGVKEIAGQQKVYLKEGTGFVYLSDNAANLANLPADPVAQLAGLESKYNVAVAVNSNGIPQQARQQLIDVIRGGFESTLQGVPEEQRAQLNASFAQFEQLINESESVVVGLAIDAAAKSIYLDFNLTAKAGTQLAQQLNSMANVKTDFAGFNIPGSAATMSFTSEMSDADKGQVNVMLDSTLQQLLTTLDEDDQLQTEEARAAAKKLLQDLFNVAGRTIDEGVIDGGAVLMLDSGLQFAAGFRVADGSSLNQTFKDLIELAKEEDIPDIKLDAAKHGDVTFHSMMIPVNDEDAQKVLGENVELLLGTGPKSAYVAFGKNSLDFIKGIIDKSAQNPGQPTTPAQLIVTLTPIIKFASQFQEDDTIGQVLAALEQSGGKDHISLTVRSEQNGFSERIEVEEGVIRAIGAAATSQMQGAGAGGGF